MKRQVSKDAKISLCRLCGGTGYKQEKDGSTGICRQCGGSGRVIVSANIELDIRPYKPKVKPSMIK